MLVNLMSKARLKLLGRLGKTHWDARRDFSELYLRGSGIEIGALHEPTPVAEGVEVKYVDRLTTEECLERYPHLRTTTIASVDVVTDGFSLQAVADQSLDFVMAHHVLEHSDNPLQTLENWCRVLRPGGVLYFSVPLANETFDRGREITPWCHLVDDWELLRDRNPELVRSRNEAHYWDWVNVSMKNMAETDQRPLELTSQASKAKYVSHMLDIGHEIHFHTFSIESVRELAARFTEEVAPQMKRLRVVDSGGEGLVLLRKQEIQ